MGYNVEQTNSKFAIRFENFEPAAKALAVLIESRKELDWVVTEELLSACRRHDFYGALEACRWDCDGDETGINSISYQCQTLGDDDHLILKTLAPFVEPGSFIEMHGEDSRMWRWKFTGEDCMEEKAATLFPSDPVYVVICDWIRNAESGVSVLGVARDRKAAERILKEGIEKEKRESWISNIAEEDISPDGKRMYVETQSEQEWSFYLNGSYCVEHTDIAIHEETFASGGEEQDDE